MTDYFIEVRSAVRRNGPPRLVPLADAYKYRGFRSVCAYDAEVAALIREQGGTQGLRGQSVYAEELFIDFDGHDPKDFREWLAGSGLAHAEYDSGNRSVHFHIPLVPVFGSWVPDAMRSWVRKQAPTADVSFYHPAGMYRLPGTYHPKQPGRRKELVRTQAGEPLALTRGHKPTLVPTQIEDASIEYFTTLLTQRVGEGRRSTHAWQIAVTASELGMPFQEAVENALFWNARFASPPHDEDTVIKQCENAYRRRAVANE